MMASSLLLLLTALLLGPFVIAQNIDVTEPIVRVAPGGLDSDAYFGFSLVLHRVTGSPSETRIVVSAPNGTATGGVSNAGVIYTCSLRQNQMCQPLNGDGGGADRRLYDTDGDATSSGITTEMKMNQFLGISMDSRDNHFIVCAHRYINRGSSGTSRLPQGRCYYTSDSRLENFQSFSFCNGRDTGDFGNCQFGTSVTLAESGGTVHIGFGAPGTRNWRGAVFRRSSSGSQALTDNNEGTRSNSWQGYTMTKGHIITTNREDLIVSVPRRNTYFGQVNVFSNDGNLDIFSQPLQGTQLGEYYGFSLATADLNGDGFDELIVGAPMYSTSNEPEIGRVYVYRNSAGSLSFVKNLVGELEYSRFGYAITNLGDVNNDGLEDIAIGAPFGQGSGRVYIYYGSLTEITSNSPVQVINGMDISTASSSQIGMPRGFGSSLASSIDVDGNGVNDLAIGAFLSQQVFFLRTRGVAQVTLTLEASPNVVNVQAGSNTTCMFPGETMNNEYPCFNVTACGSYPNINTLGDTLNLTFTFSVDRQAVSLGLERRVFFDSSRSNSISVMRTFTKNVERCITQTVYVERGISDVFNGFPVEVTVSGPQFVPNSRDGNPAQTNFTNFPQVTTAGTTQLSVETLKECENSQCIPDLRLTRLNITYETSTGAATANLTAGLVTNINFWMNLTNFRDDAFLAQLTFVIDSARFEFIRIEPRELLISCTPAVQGNTTRLNCPIANPLNSGSNRVLGVRLRPTSALTGSEGTIAITFNSTSINPEASISNLADNAIEYIMYVQAQADIHLDQAVVVPPQVSYTNTSLTNISGINVTDLGPQVTASFVVRNQGPTTVPVTQLRIYWPFRPSDATDNFLLYPSHFMVMSSVLVACNNTHINPQRLQRPPTDGGDEGQIGSEGAGNRRRRTIAPIARRPKRSLENRQASNPNSEPTPAQDITINCQNDRSQCVEIVCNVNQLPRDGSAQIDVVSYLDERYFAPRGNRYTFIFHASVHIVNSSFIVQPMGHRSDETQTQLRAVTSIPTPGEGGGVEPWVIIVPIILAIIFFAVLAVVLYFVGFFKRKSKDKKEELTAEYLEQQQGGEVPT